MSKFLCAQCNLTKGLSLVSKVNPVRGTFKLNHPIIKCTTKTMITTEQCIINSPSGLHTELFNQRPQHLPRSHFFS